MRTSMLLAVAALLGATSTLCAGASSYEETGDCGATNEHLYKYTAKEEYFGDDFSQTFEIIVHFRIFCKSVGMYGEKRARLYELDVTDYEIGGTVLEKSRSHAQDALENVEAGMKGGFQFVQTEDGSVPITLYSREEDSEIVNIKKAIVSAFQANFLGTAVKEEADPQSLHEAHYTYEASAQDVGNGVLRMHRTIASADVEGYASHLPTEEVELEKEEDIVYEKGVLTHASGTTYCKLMTKKNVAPEDDIQQDILEAQPRRKRDDDDVDTPRDPDDPKTFDPTVETNRYESKGTYTVELVGQQRRLLRLRRSSDESFSVENSLLAFINQTRKSMERMMELRHDLGDIEQSLKDLHMNTNNTAIAHKIESLVKLETTYGPLTEYSPAIEDVLAYLEPLFGLTESREVKMRLLLYFIISPEESVASQMALLRGLETAVNDDETDAVIMYIALVANPQPQLVAKLERLISSDVHSDDPLLLAYGAIVPRASPELQERMTLFLINRLPEAETNSSSLIHHILSLGNSGSRSISAYLINYLAHPEGDVQLTAILAMRFLMSEPSVEKSLKQLVNGPDVTEDHLTVIAKSLVYACERAKINAEDKPYSSDFAEALVAMALNIHNEEFHSSLATYLRAINSPDSRELLQILKFHKSSDPGDQYYTNTTRFRRGTVWDENNGVYDLVAPLSERQSDVQHYQNRLAYIWGKRFGVTDIYAEVAAGGFAGVSNGGDYKLFGRAVAKANAYDRSLTILEFLVLRQKDSQSTVSRFYAVVMGVTLKNIRNTEGDQVCKSYSEPLYEGKEYTIFDFTYSVFVVVGTLNFNLRATVQFNAGMYIEACENHGSLTLGAGLSPTLTIRVSASGDLEIIGVAKAGLTLTATFNYQVLPEMTTEVCYKESQIRSKNCIGVYHQWADNTLELYAWYAWRGWCGWWACTGSDAYRNRERVGDLSVSWDLPGTGKLTLWKTCDRSYTC